MAKKSKCNLNKFASLFGSVTHIQGFQCRDFQTRAQSGQKGQEGCCVRRGAAWSPGQTTKKRTMLE